MGKTRDFFKKIRDTKRTFHAKMSEINDRNDMDLTEVRKQQCELCMEQQTGSKSGKEYIKAVYHHPAYLTYMQSTSFKMLGWMNHRLESKLLAEI